VTTLVTPLTEILNQMRRSEPAAAEKLLPLVYDELRRLAARQVALERPEARRDATSLVHQAYLRLAGNDAQDWNSRGHFYAAAAEAMRRILIDDARRRRRAKHGGDRARVDLEADCVSASDDSDDLLALDEVLTRFADLEPEKAQVVKLRYFGGLSVEDTAAALGISPATAKRHWAYARAWLYNALADDAT
jgi:RNA polymerase sigma factor (TIGR02999 family)